MPTFDIARVVEARAVGEGRLWLRFSDGVDGTIDLAREIGDRSVNGQSDPDYFARVELAGGGVGWPDGFDCAPEWLRKRLTATIGSDTQPNDDGWGPLHRHVRHMPEISRFFGVIIRMFFSDHAPPHFHAEYGGYLISVEIDGDGVFGRFPPSRLPMLFEWRDQHRAELMVNWERMRRGEPAQAIAPLS